MHPVVSFWLVIVVWDRNSMRWGWIEHLKDLEAGFLCSRLVGNSDAVRACGLGWQ
jgi:hypothetical protein